MDTDKPITMMTDEEILSQVVPTYAKVINWIYERSFGPMDRLLDHLRGANTRKMIADFGAAEARKFRA